jgi:hypothetical protein
MQAVSLIRFDTNAIGDVLYKNATVCADALADVATPEAEGQRLMTVEVRFIRGTTASPNSSNVLTSRRMSRESAMTWRKPTIAAAALISWCSGQAGSARTVRLDVSGGTGRWCYGDCCRRVPRFLLGA